MNPNMEAAALPGRRNEDATPRKLSASERSPARRQSEDAGPQSFQPMPALPAEEYTALRDDVAARGVLVPIVVDQHGRLLDGHHRRRIADELEIDCPTEVRHVADDNEAMDLAVTLNAARQQLNREQRRDLIRAEIARRPTDSDRAIARRIGCSPTTVGAVRAGRVSNLDTPEPEPWTEAEIAARLVDIIEARYAEDPDTWHVPHQLADYIRYVWPWPTHNQHSALRDVAYPLFMSCPPDSPVWDVMGVWLYAVAQPALRGYADLEREHPDYRWPGKALAELCLVLFAPGLSDETRSMLREQFDVRLAFAVLDCERFLGREVIDRWRPAETDR